MLAFRQAEEPAPGGSILARFVAVLSIVAASVAVGPLNAQGVVLPGATYVDGPGGSATAVAAARWRGAGPSGLVLRVRFSPAPDGRAGFWDGARAALRAWEAATGSAFRFEVVGETAPVDVEFLWVEKFETSQAGATHRRLDVDGHIEAVRIVLARDHANGTPMSDAFRRFVAIHEVGHALGLPHSESPGDVMHPGNRNLEVSDRDLRSLRALYDRP